VERSTTLVELHVLCEALVDDYYYSYYYYDYYYNCCYHTANTTTYRSAIIILTLGWVGYGERRHAELPREDVPTRL
jgi:hypothetical protein